jgi:hypothetical protein
MKKIKFIAVETDIHNSVEKKLLHSCAINGIDIHILGRGVEWISFMTKINLLVEYLQTINEEIVCVTDSRDVLFISNEDTIYNKFINKFGKDIVVFNAETNIWPDKKLGDVHPNQHKKYRYLNAGCVIGNRLLLLEIYNKCVELFKTDNILHRINELKLNQSKSKFANYPFADDQYLLQYIFINNDYGDNFTIDYDCEIFQVVWDQNWGRSNNFDLIYSKDVIYNRLTDTYPSIFHFPGPTTTNSQVWKIINKDYGVVSSNNFF